MRSDDNELSLVCLRALVTSLYLAINPKLGGGGITDEMREQMRQVAAPHMSPEQRKICGLESDRQE